jgi:hypothetical protein
MLCRFLTTEPNLRVAALLRFARHHAGAVWRVCRFVSLSAQGGL